MHPKPIVRLAPDVVNRVAAGEVIHRPASALKEMLENSLDAGATAITVTVRDGGNKLLQVTDDGCGIRVGDLPILCERHTTSKLTNFEDLGAMTTFGFRGEALASMSFVANLTVTTMTKDAPHATRASYADGVLTQEGTMPTSGVPGTTITVENLFYNVPTRKRALRSPSEEFGKVLEVTQRYAASRTNVSFVVRKLGDPRPALRTPFTENKLERIRQIYGPHVAKNVMPLRFDLGGFHGFCEAGDGDDARAPVTQITQKSKTKLNPEIKASIDALVSTANGGTGRKTVFILFINNRLVECAAMKRACEAVYASVLGSKHEKPWMFVHLKVPHCTVDVNVHPTKREVRFLFQDEIVERLVEILSTVLDNANVTRIFHVGQVGPPGGGDVTETETDTRATEKVTTRTQALLPGASRPGAESPEDDGPGLGNASLVTVDPTTGDPQWTQPSKKPKTNSTRDQVARDHKLVRVDAAQTNLSLELFFHRADKETENAVRVGTDGNGTAADFGVGATPLPPPADTAMAEHEENVFLAERRAASAATSATDAIPDGATSSLSSVKTLWGEITREAHAGLTKVLRNAVLVGSLPPGSSSKQHLCLVQHKTKLHVVNMQILQREFWYQRIIARFGTFSVARLAEPAIVETLVVLALETEAVDGFPDSEVRAFQDTESHADDMDTCATADAFHDSEPTNDMATQCPEKLAAAKAVADLLFEKADMLREYFGVEFVRDGNGVTALIGLPNLLHGFFPNVNCLPEFITNLAQNVEWKEEKSCFRTVAATLAEFYGGGMGGIDDCDDETENAENDDDENVLGSNVLEDPRNSSRKLVEQRVLFPAIRKFLRPSKISHAQHVLTQVASLEQLYKVFERC